jgi:hypothetical protein
MQNHDNELDELTVLAGIDLLFEAAQTGDRTARQEVKKLHDSLQDGPPAAGTANGPKSQDDWRNFNT